MYSDNCVARSSSGHLEQLLCLRRIHDGLTFNSYVASQIRTISEFLDSKIYDCYLHARSVRSKVKIDMPVDRH